ncbi:hypothetical protein KAR91_21210 [Candidatus Pacearchaeota archaeon]|nr:hypothetical protein [Candidatus Pacearchaeota archaeon]
MNWDKAISQSIDKAERTTDPMLSIGYVHNAALCSIAKSLEAKHEEVLLHVNHDSIEDLRELFNKIIMAGGEYQKADRSQDASDAYKKECALAEQLMHQIITRATDSRDRYSVDPGIHPGVDKTATIADYIRSEELLENDIRLLKDQIKTLRKANDCISTLSDSVRRKDALIDVIYQKLREIWTHLPQAEDSSMEAITIAVEKERKV